MIKFPKAILKNIEDALQVEKKQVLIQISDLSAQDPFSDIDRLNDNAASDTEAKEETDHERYQALLTELKSKQDAIDAALKRIDKGNYGSCDNCGYLIDTDRLAALPTATLCVNCENNKKH